MEIDIQFKTARSSFSIAKDKSVGIWNFTKHITTDWNHDYHLIERTVYEFSIFILHFTFITSKLTDKKWTDGYVTGLDRLVKGLTNNEEQVLNYVDSNEDVLNDYKKRLKIISKGKIRVIEEQPKTLPVEIIEDFLKHDETERGSQLVQNNTVIATTKKSKKKTAIKNTKTTLKGSSKTKI